MDSSSQPDPALRRIARRYGRALARVSLPLFALVMLLQLCLAWYGIAGVQYHHLRGETTQPGAVEDFVSFYVAGRLVLEGRGAELYDIDTVGAMQHDALGLPAGERSLPYFNPPFLAPVFAPLAASSAWTFALLLTGVVAVMVVGCGLLLQRFLELPRSRVRGLFWLGYLSLLSVAFTVIQTQVSLLPLLGWLGFVWLQRQGRPRWSGVALTLGLVKPQFMLVPIALLVWKRQREALLGFAAVAGALVIVSVLVAGPSVLVEYPRFLLDSTRWDEVAGIKTREMFGWNGFLAAGLGDETPSPALVLPLSLLTVVALAWTWRGEWQPGSTRFHLQAAAGVCGAMLLSPHLYPQDLVLMALALTFGAAWSLRSTGSLGIWGPLAAVTWCLQTAGLPLQVEAGIPVLTPAIFGLLLLCLLLLRREERNVLAVPAVKQGQQLAA